MGGKRTWTDRPRAWRSGLRRKLLNLLLEFRSQLVRIGLGLVRHSQQDFDHARIMGHIGNAAHLPRTFANSDDLRVGHPTLIAPTGALSASGGLIENYRHDLAATSIHAGHSETL